LTREKRRSIQVKTKKKSRRIREKRGGRNINLQENRYALIERKKGSIRFATSTLGRSFHFLRGCGGKTESVPLLRGGKGGGGFSRMHEKKLGGRGGGTAGNLWGKKKERENRPYIAKKTFSPPGSKGK